MANDVEAKLKVVVDKKGKTAKHADISQNAKKFKNDMAEAESSSKSIAKNITNAFKSSGLISFIGSIKELTSIMLDSSQAQSDYVENLNLLDVAFGDTSKNAEHFIDTLSGHIGLDESALTRQLGVFRQMSNAMGYTSETADLLSMNLSKLQLDMASLYNLSFEQSGNALESALTGQVKTIRALTGADITQATLQQFALAHGIDESVNSMSRAEKTLLIYMSLEDQMAEANGDLSRTINSVSNQTKIFHEQITIAGRQIGGFFIPILKTLLPILNGILMAFNAIVKMIMTLFGIDAKSLEDEFGVATGGLNDLEEGLNAVDKASKNAKKSLRGFDKLNNITTPSTSGSSGVGGSGAGINSKILDMLDEYNLHLDEMMNKAKQISEQIMRWLGFSRDVNGEWEWSSGTLLKNIWEWWKELNLLAKIFVGLGVVAVISKLITGFKSLYNVLKSTKIWNMLSLIVETLGRKGLVGTITELNSVYGVLAQFIEVLVGVIAIVDGVFKLADGIKAIANGTAELGDYLGILWGFLEVISGIALVVGGLTSNAQLITTGITGLGIAIGGQLLTNLVEANEQTKQWADNLWKLGDSQQRNLDLAITQSGELRAVKDSLLELYDANGNLTGSYEQATTKLSFLNDQLGTNYTITKDGTIMNGKAKVSLDELSKSVDIYCQKLRAEATIEAYREDYIKAIKTQREKQEEYDKILKQITESEKNYNLETEKGKKEWLLANRTKLEKLNDLDSQIKTNEQRLSNYEKASYEVTQGNYDKASEYMKHLGEKIEVTFDETADKTIKSMGKIPNEFHTVMSNINGAKYEASIKVIIDTAEAEQKLKNYEQKIKTMTSPDYSAKPSTKITYKADGGFISDGQLFVAREAGPEMVGTIGGKTAVANNDQIVEAISIGVAKAMMSTQKDTTVNIVAEGDTSGLLDFIEFKQRQKNRQYGM